MPTALVVAQMADNAFASTEAIQGVTTTTMLSVGNYKRSELSP
jgi:hypothetical protein